MNTNTTPACGTGRKNVHAPRETIFTMTTKPTAMIGFSYDTATYCILRDASGTPHFVMLDGANALRDIDGVRHVATTIVQIDDGEKIAFDRYGDVWQVTARPGSTPTFGKC